MASDKLTGKQRKFATEYVVCLNGTEAARRAGYAGDDATLAVTATRTLRNAKVARAIDEMLEKHAMAATEVLAHLTDIARGDIADALNSMGGIDPTEAVRRGKSHLVKRFKTKTITSDDSEIHETEIEMYDRLKALDMLAKYHDLVNRVRVVDWRDEVVALLKAGDITPQEVEDELGVSLAEELFIAAGVPVSRS